MKNKPKDIITNIPIIPDETIIYYSRGRTFYQIIVCLCFALIGLFFNLNSKELFGIGIWSIFSIVWIYVGYKSFRNYMNRKPQIILNEKGMQTISTQFYNWNEIKGNEVIKTGAGKYIHYYLIYEHPNGKEKLKIDDYNTSQKKLNKLIETYREKNKEKTTNR